MFVSKPHEEAYITLMHVIDKCLKTILHFIITALPVVTYTYKAMNHEKLCMQYYIIKLNNTHTHTDKHLIHLQN